MRGYIQAGDSLNLLAPSGGVTSGTPLLVGGLLVVPATTALEGVAFAGRVDGVFEYTKTSAQAWTAGQRIYWNTSTSKFDSDGSTGPLVGVATEIKANPTSTGIVRLNGGVGEGSEGPQPVIAALTGTPTGTANGSIVDVAAAAAATAGGSTPTAAQVDTGIATAVAPIVTGVNEQNKELMTKFNELLAAAKVAGWVASS